MNQFEGVAILVPDGGGKAVKEAAVPGSFFSRLKWEVPGAKIFVIINNVDEMMVSELVLEAETQGLHPLVWLGGAGLRGALAYGYSEVAKFSGINSVVRMDTDEHPIEAVRQLVEHLSQYGVVVGDLHFPNGENLVAGSVDEFYHRSFFPMVYDGATDGNIAIGCGHGMMALRHAVLAPIISNVEKIREQLRLLKLESIEGGWAYDGMVVLAAHAARLKLCRQPVQAFKVRNREPLKCLQQGQQALAVITAAQQAFPGSIGRLYQWAD